ncbi:hypothetical protein FACS1894187_05360 [Synergistales bacterium]|nr:hypothetical protein FACS1894187_05360 [Synergistales bacterium]
MDIRYYREKAHLSQEQLAELCGISQNHISQIELEKKQPSLKIFKKLCEVLGTSEREILNGPEEEGFTVEIKFVKNLEGVNDEMKVGGYVLEVGEDGWLGINGTKKFDLNKGEEQIQEVLRVIDFKLRHGLRAQREMKEDWDNAERSATENKENIE